MRKKWFEEQIVEFKTRSDNEVLEYLSSYWNITPDAKGVLTMVGTYKKADHKDRKGNDFAYFEDIRNTEGDILYYPFGFGKVKLWTTCNDKLEKQDIWRINVKLSPKKFRDKNPFIISLADTNFCLPSTNLKDKLSRESQIRKIFKDTGFTERDAKNTVNALHNIMDDLYSNADDRFVYELLQNADDQPEEGQLVSVILQLLKEHLLFMHNGRVFDTDDVDSICSIGDSTKRKDKEKIGYKGIGFKSVFTGSDTVIINSGNYSFAFDKYSPIYGDADMNNIPWQLKPIWQERYRYPKEVKENETFWKERVGISLEVEEDNLNDYRMSIARIFTHPIFLLFLKNVTNLEFDEGELRTKISKSHDGDILRIEKDGIVDSSWVVKDYPIIIPQEIRDALQDDHNVPEKLKKATMTQISFAAKVEDGKIVKLDNSVLYAYLPTSVNDFGFNFIVNADFLLAANREQLHVKKIWNQFLFSEIGKLLIDWVASLSTVIPSYLEILPNSLLNVEETGTLSLSPFFNKAFTEALESQSFIKVTNEEAAKQEEIIIDKTGLYKIIGADKFLEILNSEKHLPSEDINHSVFDNKIFEGIERITIDKAVTKMSGNEKLISWYQSASEEKQTEFFNWLIEHKDKCATIIKSLPIIQFGKDFISIDEATKNKATRIIITEHLDPIKDIVKSLGFVCSDKTYRTEDILWPYLSASIWPDQTMFTSICAACEKNKVQSLSDRIRLVKAFKDFTGVGESSIKALKLFRNMNGINTVLNGMVIYRANAPEWLNPYMIRQDEYSEDLKSYLVATDDEFKSVIWPNISSINVSIDTLYSLYNWSDEAYTRTLIGKCSTKEQLSDLINIVEGSNSTTKTAYLNQISKINLDANKKYTKDSLESRVLQLALNTLSDPTQFSSKIFYGDKCITQFSMKDEVNCEYRQNGTTKKILFSLSTLLPQYKDQANSMEQIKTLFETKSGLEKFFVAKTKPQSEIFSELNSALGMTDKHQRYWPTGKGNYQQYLFSIYYRKAVYYWYENKSEYNNYRRQWVTVQSKSYPDIPSIDLNQESESFVSGLFDFLFSNDVSINDAPFTCKIKDEIKGKYIDNDFIFDNEQVKPVIERWCKDVEDKKKYLIDNGLRDITHKTIIFRESFLADKQVAFMNEISDTDAFAGLKFFTEAEGYNRPFNGLNQRAILLDIFARKDSNINRFIDMEKLQGNSTEWDSSDYDTWKVDHHPYIYIFKGNMPWYLSYQNTRITDYEDKDYYYNSSEKKLYINGDCSIDSLLYEIAIEGKSGIDKDDYRILCIEGKVSVTQEALQEKDNTIALLKADNERLIALLKKYGINDESPQEKASDNDDTQKSKTKEEELKEDVIERPDLSQDEQASAHKEAEEVVREKLVKSGYDCSGWILDDEVNDGKWHSYNQIEGKIKDPDGVPVNVVVKSAKGGYIYLSATDFEFLTQDSKNLLLVWDGDDVHSVSGEDLFTKDSNVNLIFDTEYTPKHYYAALSKVFQYVKRTTFAVKDPKRNTYSQVQGFGMDAKTEGIQELFDDNDL